ncbi:MULTISPECIES: carbamoyl-phosphate synthase large subunit [Prochlorococcus]|uniref:Carbamoyl phosphate synthase large chain n=1 Tax=Prochlorococcus marinus (strain SARG / CCMP1375 / SS120) TaxID=167539 RepID=Q7VC45_PROMA|nr:MULTISPECIES: carbamoyl-phosphate synthase large subunit [Prochlorococcus]AAP99941.1 Carbamoylphosphate synthase large subunit [Prochlorococcus marinus subsp. marinus str. CCMP1375]KGG11714.1 Carbamoyl-phosphate synthase large chain [Prochlorococcus marinus str. LG]KGG18873.1 Carbamoyl-phosphate synthase large chain [Prochlorococcus marinus str. SS2]KGG23589.1 Carbamoyl-phosphate synthase large chain [Prochlorococcus marinus str. SS35]KGG32175.1 Carbamoyl-phosphate synthase large chain [Pro
MPRRNDIRRILILGSGPIVIGQACEFDYSGTQACKALKKEGFEVVLINSNPASIMTDPEMADRTYIEPLTTEVITKIIELEKPDALLPTMGGQTALNAAVDLAEKGILRKFKIELIGADLESINKAEDRQLFKNSMEKIGVNVCPSGIACNIEEAINVGSNIESFPRIIRPAFTLGGSGGGIAYNQEEFISICKSGLEASPASQILIEKSLLGWKEFELEVMRDNVDNVVIICSIENIDPMGIHTGDSITIAPAQTLTDREYQRLRDQSIKIIREIGVETGGSNVQFAVNPVDGEVVVIEMNPRVSRSSALASKATGFPIAKIAALLAIGYRLDEILNDITGKTPCCFEPTIDYIVTKIPRFAFEKFSGSPPILTTSMKSVGEVMAIGRSFEESFQKALRSLEIGLSGWSYDCENINISLKDIDRLLRVPSPDRLMAIKMAMYHGKSDQYINSLSNIDIWFLSKLRNIMEAENNKLLGKTILDLDYDSMFELKKLGFSDSQIGFLVGEDELRVRSFRKDLNIKPVYKTVDTCSSEFESNTPYHYSTYERTFKEIIKDGSLINKSSANEVIQNQYRKILILGGGPNRIGQGIEFDYCCCHSSFQLQKEGFQTIMLNSNPETVSTDYDTSDSLYFEPLTFEDVLNVIELENPEGIIVQFGGQTPLKLAMPILNWLDTKEGKMSGSKIFGTSPKSIDQAEDREQFEHILRELRVRQPSNGIARSISEAEKIANRISYPLVVRPSYVLGGRAMEIVYDSQELKTYMNKAVKVEPDHPVLIDEYLENAIEVDVDALSDSFGNVVIAGLMEHIEPAGIHSGDSACCLPSISLSDSSIKTIKEWTNSLAKSLNVIGLINLQFAVQRDDNGEEKVFIIEANPRASRTIPFVSKAIGWPLARLATSLLIGKTLHQIGILNEPVPPLQTIKEAVMPFRRFPGSDSVLGPEMRSTGEVMSSAKNFGMAYAKSELAAGEALPTKGIVFLSTHNRDKPALIPIARRLVDLGFGLIATSGTAEVISNAGIDVSSVLKVHEGRPNIEDVIRSGQIQLIINTPIGRQAIYDDKYLRRAALDYSVPTLTTLAGARAAVEGICALQNEPISVTALQDIHSLVTFHG